MEKLFIDTLQTDVLGLIGIALTESGLTAVRMFQGGERSFIEDVSLGREFEVVTSSEHTAPVLAQIKEYLQGKRMKFEVEIDWSEMTDFQQAVLHATQEIPFAETCSYGDIAAIIGHPLAARAVGQAESNNPNPLVIPCHRVIGADGGLRGYGGAKDVNTKAWLLAFEKRVAGNR